MATSHSVSKVVVVGGGIFGASSAVHLARLGIETVLVNDGPLAKGASGRSLAWLNSARKRSAEYHRLRMIGIDRYRTLSARYPDAAWLRFDGGLTWDADDASNEIADVFAHEKNLGYDAQYLAPSGIASVTPGIAASAVTPQGAIFNPGEGWVDLPSLINLLVAEFMGLGGRLITDAGSAKVTVVDGRATGVTTTGGASFASDAVLLATGADVPRMVADSGRHIADGTPIALIVRTKPVHLPLRAVLNTPRVAIRPTPDGALALDSAWSEAEVAVNSDGTFGVKSSTIQGLLDEASKVLDGHPRLELQSYGAGPKPIPGDGEPVFGRLRDLEGYYVAFSHSGATLGLIGGELLAGEIASGNDHPLLSNFRPGRFA
jgi:glycine/D-amino acid oxidase-like deaminating enzyme